MHLMRGAEATVCISAPTISQLGRTHYQFPEAASFRISFSKRQISILSAYARCYNDIRTHRSLDKDAPVSRSVQRMGLINSHAILSGLHRHYVRV